ncbi:hypothetical protein [Amycolatopsis methanolica]|uniref:hypothetical protein n=1 Tax=Amycolatopsis methanolica TaxID=1814 RepID=UPI00341D38F9
MAVTSGYGHRGVDYRLRPGTAVTHLVRTTDGWYDVTVSAPGLTRQLAGHVETGRRQLAGHVETGRLSRTDPALGA